MDLHHHLAHSAPFALLQRIGFFVCLRHFKLLDEIKFNRNSDERSPNLEEGLNSKFGILSMALMRCMPERLEKTIVHKIITNA